LAAAGRTAKAAALPVSAAAAAAALMQH